MEKVDLLRILKRCSFNDDKSVTDAQLAAWFSDHKKVNPTTIQKMLKGERTCTFGQTVFRFAFTNASNSFDDEQTFISRINNILFDLYKEGVISNYNTLYKPLYETYLKTSEFDIFARVEYTSALVQSAFIESPDKEHRQFIPYECVDDIVSMLKQSDRSTRIFDLDGNFSVETDYIINDGIKRKLSIYIMNDRIICHFPNLLQVNRTYEILDTICELNSFPNPSSLTVSISADNKISMHYVINTLEAPGLRCKSVIEEAEATVFRNLLEIYKKHKENVLQTQTRKSI